MTKESQFRYKMTIAYDGTDFSGWQVQPNATSIQQVVEEVVKVITKEPSIRVIGSGRTDAGVHALGQVAHFTIGHEIDTKRFLRSMNGLLPPEIRVLEITSVPVTFHAQKSATAKIYHYRLALDPIILPFDRRYVTAVRKPLDIELLKRAAKHFVGKHDFSAFANSQHEGACAKNPVREIYSIEVVPEKGGVRLEFYGNGFLYKMVRNIVGMLLEVATGKRPMSEIDTVMKGKDRRKAPKSADARGLSLVQVFY